MSVNKSVCVLGQKNDLCRLVKGNLPKGLNNKEWGKDRGKSGNSGGV